MLDKLDRKIITELELDGRIPISRIAKKAGVSKDTVHYRVEKYKQTGLLDGSYALVNAAILGFIPVRFYCTYRNTTPETEQKIISYLCSEKRLWFLAKTQGYCDLGGGIWVRNLDEFLEFWITFRERFARYITKLHHSIFVTIEEYPRMYLMNRAQVQPKSIDFTAEKQDFDYADKKIIELLASNARIRATQIASQVRLSTRAAINRMRVLEKKGVICGYKPKINTEKYGYRYTTIFITFGDSIDTALLQAYVRAMPNLWQYQTVFGGFDFEFAVEVSSREEMFALFDDLRSQFGSAIESIQYYWAREVILIRYMPQLLH